MRDQLPICNMYIDYEGLMSALSRRRCFDVDPVLISTIERSRHDHEVVEVEVFADWDRFPLLTRSRLESNGCHCLTIGVGLRAEQAIRQRVEGQLQTGSNPQTCILVGGDSGFESTLWLLAQNNVASELWVALPPSQDAKALCSHWELIALPQASLDDTWPRRVMLQAIALVANDMQDKDQLPLIITDLSSRLQELSSFQQLGTELWLNIAIREGILLLDQPSSSLGPGRIRLDRQHSVSVKALRTRDRIMSTLSCMLADREWVAFSALERALRTYKYLADSQQLRHAWLELLVATKVLIAERIMRPGGTYPTTGIRPNSAHPAAANVTQRQQHALIRLIVITDNIRQRNGSQAVSISQVLDRLTETTTRIEARAVLEMAKTQQIIRVSVVPNHRNPDVSITAIRLDYTHPFVQEVLATRDTVIRSISALEPETEVGIGGVQFREEVHRSAIAEPEDAEFWRELLVHEGILGEVRYVRRPGQVLPYLHLETGDPVVEQALERHTQQSDEVIL